MALVVGVVIIGNLESRHINAGFWTNYGADLIGPVWIYSILRQLKLWKGQPASAEVAAVGMFTGCFLWEWCQRYDLRGTVLSFTAGTFDPYDILCYAISLGVAYAVDRAFQRMASQTNVHRAR